jgi:bifunctional non-homologous end joining protein LigD
VAEKVIRRDDLHKKNSGSDKVYHLALVDHGDGRYSCYAKWGRRGSSLQGWPKDNGVKAGRVSQESARNIYSATLNEKLGEGYQDSPGVSGQVWPGEFQSAAPVQDGTPAVSLRPEPKRIFEQYLPMLLNPVDEARAEVLLANDDWLVQEKLDGLKVMARLEEGTLSTFNKKGQLVSRLLPESEQALRSLGFDVVLDGEYVGGCFHAVDLLESRGVDFRPRRRSYAYETLRGVLEGSLGRHLAIVEAAFDQEAKRELFSRMKGERREGVVFKRKNAPYVAGRPASGGDALKFKFLATCSCFVLGQNARRSVSLGLLSVAGNEVCVGSVTIPPNREIPGAGEIVEVRYLYVQQEGGSLFQPCYLGVREDVEKIECVVGQLKYKRAEEE